MLFSPVPIDVLVLPIVVNKQPHSAVPSSFGAATIPSPVNVSKWIIIPPSYVFPYIESRENPLL